jgi:hypothetical protein
MPRSGWWVPAVLGLVCGWTWSVEGGSDEVLITVQAVQASDFGQNTDKPEIAPSLKPYTKHLHSLKQFGKYQDAGRDQGAGKSGQTLSLKVSGCVIEVELPAEKGAKNVSIKVVVKDQRDNKTYPHACRLRPNNPEVLMVRDPKSPLLLLFLLGEIRKKTDSPKSKTEALEAAGASEPNAAP